MKKSRLIIMDIIIVILVVLNAAMIIAVAEYYNAEFYKNVYKTMGNTQKLKQMEEQSDMALKRMGSLSILKQKIDSIVNVPDRQTK